MVVAEVALGVAVALCGSAAVAAAWRWAGGLVVTEVNFGDEDGGGGGGEPQRPPVGPPAGEPVGLPEVSIEEVWRLSEGDLVEIEAWLSGEASPVPA